MKRFLLGVLSGLIIAGVTGVVLFFAAVRFATRPAPPPSGSLLSLTLEGPIPEAAPLSMPFPAFEDVAPMTVSDVWNALHQAAKDPAVKGVFVKPRGLQIGWAKAAEIREGLSAVRKAGKPVYVWLSSPGAKEYYLATTATKVFISPDDLVDLKGLRVEAMYFKGTLDKLGVEFQVEHAGKYKDAGDTFTRSSMSPETKESLNALLDGLFAQLIKGIAEGRRLEPDKVRSLMDDGPFLAVDAKAIGLIDDLRFEGDARMELEKATASSGMVPARDYVRGGGGIRGKARKIAVLTAEGDILRSGAPGLFGEQGVVTPAGMRRQVRAIGDDASIRGVILRVDSPGGDAVASDEILAELKELAKKKPVVVSMSDVAASGGYLISMTGNPVVAYPSTITGSIGVIYGKVVLKGLYEKFGVSTEILKRGRFADIDSASQPLTPEGRKKLQVAIDAMYQSFLKTVSAGRKLGIEKIQPFAEGRVWVGTDAKEHGLVDELGGLDRAVALVRTKTTWGADDTVLLQVYPRPRSLFEELLSRKEETRAPGASPLEMLIRQTGPGIAPFLQGGMLRVLPVRLEAK